MRIRELLKEEDVENNKKPISKKEKLRNELKKISSVIDRYEKTGEIHKDDMGKIETLKDFIRGMIKEGEFDK